LTFPIIDKNFPYHRQNPLLGLQDLFKFFYLKISKVSQISQMSNNSNGTFFPEESETIAAALIECAEVNTKPLEFFLSHLSLV